MRQFALIGIVGDKSHVLALPDVAVNEQMDLRKEILRANGAVPKSKIKLDRMILFATDAAAKINRFKQVPEVAVPVKK